MCVKDRAFPPLLESSPIKTDEGEGMSPKCPEVTHVDEVDDIGAGGAASETGGSHQRCARRRQETRKGPAGDVWYKNTAERRERGRERDPK